MKPPAIDEFRYMGIQDGKAVYSWINNGNETQPWMTMSQCRVFSQIEGNKPMFVDESKNSSGENK